MFAHGGATLTRKAPGFVYLPEEDRNAIGTTSAGAVEVRIPFAERNRTATRRLLGMIGWERFSWAIVRTNRRIWPSPCAINGAASALKQFCLRRIPQPNTNVALSRFRNDRTYLPSLPPGQRIEAPTNVWLIIAVSTTLSDSSEQRHRRRLIAARKPFKCSTLRLKPLMHIRQAACFAVSYRGDHPRNASSRL